MFMSRLILLLPLLVVFSLWSLHFAEAQKKDKKKAPTASLNQLTRTQKQNDRDATASQKKITQIANATRSLLDDYRVVNRQVENTKVYNQQLRDLIGSQKKEMKSIGQQIQGLAKTNKEILPLMSRMIDHLEKFISLDSPFLPDERRHRLETLKVMIKRADVSTSEKYRRILEAYQIENEYGRTIEAYKGLQKHDGQELTVDFLRIGRLSLIYQSVNGDKGGYWDKENRRWANLPSEYKKTVRRGIRMARKQLAPDLIKIPIGSSKVTQ